MTSSRPTNSIDRDIDGSSRTHAPTADAACVADATTLVPTKPLTPDEVTVLGEVRSATATHWISRALGWPDNHVRTRRLLAKLAARGLLNPLKSTGGRIFWWKPTEAGRAALDHATGDQ